MTTNPPYSLEDRTPADLPELAVDVEEIEDCDCPWGSGPYPDEGEADPTCIRQHDKWDLMQCRTCGGVWWRHDVRADYGIPEMDSR